MAVLLSLGATGVRTAQAQSEWVQQGPLGAQFNTIVVDPVDPSIVYVGIQGKGVYRSANAGGSWTPRNNGLPTLEIKSLVVNPSVPTTLFAVTGNPAGVFRTTDGGEHWTAASGGLYTGAGSPAQPSLVIDPSTPSTMYLAGYSRGLHRSLDGGQTWALATTGFTEGDTERISCVAVDPVTPTTVYACGRARFFRSTDRGDHWTRIDASGYFRAQTLLVDPITPTTLYHASTEVTQGGVHRSLDGGVTWTPLIRTPVSSVVLDPLTPSKLYACTFFAGVYKTIDGGTTWEAANAGLTGCSFLALHPVLTGRLFVISGNGPFRSTDAAASWQPANAGLTFVRIPHLVADPATPSTIYALGGSLLRSTDMGTTWNRVAGISLTGLVVHPLNPAILYATTGSRVMRSADGGTNWSLSDAGIPDADRSAYAIAIDPVVPSTLYVGTASALYRSTDAGDTWTPGGGLSGYVLTVAIAPSAPANVYAAVVQNGVSGVFRSRDRGLNWSAASTGLPADVTVTALGIDPTLSSVLYAATVRHGVFRTIDAGDSWSPANTNLPLHTVSPWFVPVRSVVVDPQQPSTIYAATQADSAVGQPGAGVFRSTNRGTTWEPMNAGLTDLSVLALAIDPFSSSVLYAGTESSSVFRWQPTGVRRLTVTKPGSGVGIVTSTPAGVSCGLDCFEEYPIDSTVTLHPVAEPPSTFVSFGGDPDCVDGVVRLSDNRTCTATFTQPAYRLSITKSGLGSGTVTSSPPGITCGTDCDESFGFGTVVTLTATPASGQVFIGWSNDCAGAALTCQVAMTRVRDVTATFGVGSPGRFGKLAPSYAATGVATTGLALTWQAATFAESYEYCYDTTFNGACDGPWTTTSTTTAVVGPLLPAVAYSWHVRARNREGVTDADSGVWWPFTTSASPGPPTNDVAVDLGSAYGVWILALDSVWRPLHSLSPVAMATGDLDGNGSDDLVLNFGPGIGVYAWMNHATWVFIHPTSPSQMVAGDIDRNGRDDIVFVFAGYGVWRWSDGTWVLVHGLDASRLAVGRIDGVGGDDLILDFPGYGLYLLANNATWALLYPLSAAALLTADLDGNGGDDIVINFGNAGLWVYRNNSTWVRLHGLSPAHIATGHLDNNAQADLVIDFGPTYGLWTFRNNTTWAPLHGLSAEGLILVDRDATGSDEVLIDFGPTYGLWEYANDSTWRHLHGLSPEGMTAGRFH